MAVTSLAPMMGIANQGTHDYGRNGQGQWQALQVCWRGCEATRRRECGRSLVTQLDKNLRGVRKQPGPKRGSALRLAIVAAWNSGLGMITGDD